MLPVLIAHARASNRLGLEEVYKIKLPKFRGERGRVAREFRFRIGHSAAHSPFFTVTQPLGGGAHAAARQYAGRFLSQGVLDRSPLG